MVLYLILFMNCKLGYEKKIIWVWILYGEIKYDKKIGYDLDFFLFIWYYNYFVYFGFGMIMYYVMWMISMLWLSVILCFFWFEVKIYIEKLLDIRLGFFLFI